MKILSRDIRFALNDTTDGCVSGSGIDLENIVYYKDNTHYFVMTAKKQSLLDKGVIIHVSSGFRELKRKWFEQGAGGIGCTDVSLLWWSASLRGCENTLL